MSFYKQLVEELSTNFHSEVSGYIANSLKVNLYSEHPDKASKLSTSLLRRDPML